MVKKRTQSESEENHAEQRPFMNPGVAPLREDRNLTATNLIEFRPGLFLNRDHIVSVRVLPEAEDPGYAVMQLSSGEKHSLTRAEFTAVTGEEPRSAARLSQRELMERHGSRGPLRRK